MLKNGWWWLVMLNKLVDTSNGQLWWICWPMMVDSGYLWLRSCCTMFLDNGDYRNQPPAWDSGLAQSSVWQINLHPGQLFLAPIPMWETPSLLSESTTVDQPYRSQVGTNTTPDRSSFAACRSGRSLHTVICVQQVNSLSWFCLRGIAMELLIANSSILLLLVILYVIVC